MTPEEENVALLRPLYAAWNETKGASFGAFLDIIADDVDWRSLADGGVGMDFTRSGKTKGDVERYFEGLGRDWEMLHYVIDDYVAQGDRVVALGRCGFRHRRTGRVVETDKADVVRIRDGRIVSFFEYYDTAGVDAATRD